MRNRADVVAEIYAGSDRLISMVTGGGSGLGAATARQLAVHGARVAVLDINHAAVSVINIVGKGAHSLP